MFKTLLKFFLMSGIVFAAVTEPDKMLLSPSRNVIFNGGFEQGAAGWTAVGATFTTTGTAANVAFGNRAGGMLGSAAAQTLTSKLVSVPVGMYGRNGVASCLFQTPSGTATHFLQVTDGTNVFVSQQIASSTNYTRTLVNFIFPSSGSIALQVMTQAVSEPQIYLDDCYIQPADALNLTQVSQAAFVGQVQWNVQGIFGFSPTGPSYSDAVSNTFGSAPVISGNVSPANAISSVNQFGVHWTGGPGTYQATFNSQDGSFGSGCTSTSSAEGYQIIDENNNVINQGYIQQTSRSGLDSEQSLSLTGSWTYTTGGTHDWHIQMAGTCSTTALQNQGTNVGFSTVILNFLPGPSQLALNPQTAAWFVDADYGSYSVSTFTGYYPAGATLTARSGSLPVSVPCSGTNPPDPSGNCSSGTSESGVSYNQPTAGTVRVCYQSNAQMSSGTSQNDYVFTAVDWTANDDDSVVIESGGQYSLSQNNFDATGSSQVGTSWTVCQNFVVLNPGQVTFRTNQQINRANAISIGSGNWTVVPITQNMPMPVLLDSVTLPNQARNHIEVYQFLCGNTGSTMYFTTDTGASISNAADPGTCGITFGAGTFNSNVTCAAMGAYPGPNSSSCSTQGFANSGGASFTVVANGSIQNSYCQMICVGSY